MLNPQIMQAKVKLAETKKAYKENKLRIMRIIREIHNTLNPYFGDDIESIKAEEVEQAADELLVVKKELIEQRNLIAMIESDIGEV